MSGASHSVFLFVDVDYTFTSHANSKHLQLTACECSNSISCWPSVLLRPYNFPMIVLPHSEWVTIQYMIVILTCSPHHSIRSAVFTKPRTIVMYEFYQRTIQSVIKMSFVASNEYGKINYKYPTSVFRFDISNSHYGYMIVAENGLTFDRRQEFRHHLDIFVRISSFTMMAG